MWFLLACAKPVPPLTLADAAPAPVLRPKECTAMLGIGMERRVEGDVTRAVDTWTEGYNRCGAGYGFVGRIAEAQVDDTPDAALLLAARELTESGPFAATVDLVIRNWTRATPSTQSQLRALGTDAARPMSMPDLGAALAWTNNIVCDGAAAALTVTPGVDTAPFRIDATCGGATTTHHFALRELPAP